MNVPRRQIGERAATLVFELVAARAAWGGRGGLVGAAERLQLALLIRADHVLVGPQPLGFEHPLIQVKHTGGLLGELWVASIQPRALLPGLERVVVQPSPDRRR